MALSVHTGAITDKGSTGNQAYTGLGFTPKVVLFFSRICPTVNTASTHSGYNFGVGISSSEQGCIASLGYPAFNKPEVSQQLRNDLVMLSTWTAAQSLTTISFVSQDVDGFTVNWTARNASLPQQGFYIALGGDDLTHVSLDFFTAPTSTGDTGFTGVDFEPDAILIGATNTDDSVPNSDINELSVAFGMATEDAEVCIANGIFEKNTPNAGSQAYDGKVLSLVTPTEGQGSQANLTSMDAGGFTLNFTDVTSGAFKFFALSLKGPAFFIGSDTQKTSTGTKATTGVGFLPRALLLTGINRTASTSIQANAWTQFGSGSNSLWSRLRNSGSTDGDSDGLSNNDSILEAIPDTGTTSVAIAELDSLDSDGFTLDWTTADATARAFYFLAVGDGSDPLAVDAQSTVTLSHEARGLGTYRAASSIVLTSGSTAELEPGEEPLDPVDADSTISLTSTAVGLSLTVSAESSIFLTSSADGELSLMPVSASSTVSLGSAATGVSLARKDVVHSLVLTSTAVAIGPIEVDATSTIELTSTGYKPIDRFGSANSLVVLEQSAIDIGPVLASAVSTLVPGQDVDTNVKLRSLTQSLGLSHEIEVTQSKLVKHTIVLTQTAERSLRRTATSQILNMTSTAEVPRAGLNTINLSDSAGVILPTATEFASHKIILTQLASVYGDRSVSASSTLGLMQAVAYETDDAHRLCFYMPFIGSGSMPPSIPAADNGSFTKGIKLEQGVSSFTTTRSMNYGDIDRLVFDRINRTSRGGTLLVYADPIWPKLETLVFSVSGVKQVDARAYLDFLEPRVGQQMTLTTHEGREWTGVVMNPDEAVIQDSRESFTISIEFQGTEVS